MSKYHLQTLVVIFGIILLGTTWALSGNGGERFLVESSRPLSFAVFNKSLGDADGKGKSWVHDPIRVVLEYMDSRGSRLVNIQREDVAHSKSTPYILERLIHGNLQGKHNLVYLDQALTNHQNQHIESQPQYQDYEE